jgi:hypothetical protein
MPRPKDKNDFVPIPYHRFSELAVDVIETICQFLEVKLEEIDRAALFYGMDIPINYALDAPDIPAA